MRVRCGRMEGWNGMAELDQTSIVPLYKQLKDLIKKQILSGELKPNQKIPSELELSQQYQISRITVRNAISELVDEDMLIKKQGKGTFVYRPKIEDDLLNGSSFTNLCRRNGMVPGSRTLKLMLKEPTDRDVRELQLGPGEKVIYLQRLRYANGQPVILENNYFPEHFTSLLDESLDDVSLYSVLREKYGVYLGASSKVIQITEALDAEAALLGVRVKTPLLQVREVCYDRDDLPVHRTKVLILGDKFKYIIPKH